MALRCFSSGSRKERGGRGNDSASCTHWENKKGQKCLPIRFFSPLSCPFCSWGNRWSFRGHLEPAVRTQAFGNVQLHPQASPRSLSRFNITGRHRKSWPFFLFFLKLFFKRAPSKVNESLPKMRLLLGSAIRHRFLCLSCGRKMPIK